MGKPDANPDSPKRKVFAEALLATLLWPRESGVSLLDMAGFWEQLDENSKDMCRKYVYAIKELPSESDNSGKSSPHPANG